MKTMRITLLSAAVATCATLALTGCSGSGSPTPGSPAASAAPAKSPPAAAAPKVSAEKVCEYLRGKLPELKAIGSTVGAGSNLAVNLFDWYDKQGAVPEGALIDQQTKAQCPEVRTQVLKVAGFESFATL